MVKNLGILRRATLPCADSGPVSFSGVGRFAGLLTCSSHRILRERQVVQDFLALLHFDSPMHLF